MKLKRLKNQFSESLNNFLYGSRQTAYALTRAITLLASIAALGLLIYVYGFEPREREVTRIFNWLDFIFVIFVISFGVRIIYAFRRREFLKDNLFESLLVSFIILNGVSNYLLGNLLLEGVFSALGFNNYESFYQVFITIFMFLLLGFEVTKASLNLAKVTLKPATTFILSFLLLIAVGTGLLMLPAMTVREGSMPFLEALFTSVSASCVTGLIVVDTATYFTFKGQLIIMILIQLGGLGIVSFATFFATFLRQGVGIKQQLLIQDFLSSESLFSARGLLKQIILITLVIEAGTFFFIYHTWNADGYFDSTSDKLFFSLFHAISAFCNAGFSTFTNNLYEPVIRTSYILHMVVVTSVILGGLGFSSLEDLFSIQRLRDRFKNPWKDWRLATKVAVFTSLGLLVFGTIVIFVLEYDNTLKGMNFTEKAITSFFQSGVARTAGFNTVYIGEMRQPTLLVMIFLMFIGASSGSVGGGIKTSTFYLIVVSVASTLRGREKIEIGRRYIPNEMLFKALSIFFFAASINLIGIFVLTLTEPGLDLLDLAFEHVSAFGTVGLSTGITADLSAGGRIMIIISMFLGRVGTLTFALALSTRASSKNYKYPRAHFMVG
ncbi:TrkH family potassium uptake protein [Roseivirga sp. BDSF3-8]|uniref:TrkH family potassium uptake protein n=1 Tax=Roseivirga sp. BDSF3-8 TaxID=3241598 RepID=UPI0035322710